VKSSRMSGLVALVIALLSSPALAQIPSEAKEAANELSFVADIARRCDAALSSRGRGAVRSPDCLEFLDRSIEVLEKLAALNPLVLKAAREMDQSPLMRPKVEWQFFIDDIERDMDTVTRARQHLTFLSERAPAPRGGKR
jgi:hypothetical protein